MNFDRCAHLRVLPALLAPRAAAVNNESSHSGLSIAKSISSSPVVLPTHQKSKTRQQRYMRIMQLMSPTFGVMTKRHLHS